MMCKQFKIQLLIFFFSCLWIASCSEYQDKGNYNYTPINKITFDSISNNIHYHSIKNKYIIAIGDTLKIKPRLTIYKIENGKRINSTQPINLKNYSFRWDLFKSIDFSKTNLSISDSNSYNDNRILISTKKDLDTILLFPEQRYPALYTVTDNKTGIKFTKYFQIEFKKKYSQGWYVLSDVGSQNGGSRLDMLATNNFNDETEKNYKFLYNILSHTGLTLKGTPNFIALSDINERRIYISTSDNGTVYIDSLKNWKDSDRISSEFVSPKPKKLNIDLYKTDVDLYRPENLNQYIVKDGKLYFAVFASPYFSDPPVSSEDNSNYQLAPYVEMFYTIPDLSSFRRVLVYDRSKKRFLKYLFDPYKEKKLQKLPEKTPNDNIDLNDTKKELVYMTSNSYKTQNPYVSSVSTILKDPGTKDYYFLNIDPTKFLPSWYINYGMKSIVSQRDYHKIEAPDFNRATHYYFSKEGKLYYSVGGKVYMYNVQTRITKQILDKSPKQITLLKIINYQLVVCSYDASKPKDKCGTMDVLLISLQDDSVIVKYTFNDKFGKIKSVVYKK